MCLAARACVSESARSSCRRLLLPCRASQSKRLWLLLPLPPPARSFTGSPGSPGSQREPREEPEAGVEGQRQPLSRSRFFAACEEPAGEPPADTNAAVLDRNMLKVTMPSSSSAPGPAAPPAGRVGGAAASPAAAAVPDYWIDGSNRDTLADFFELESELGR